MLITSCVSKQARAPALSTHDGLFAEDELAGVDGGLDVDRTEPRRCREDDVVDVGLQQLLIGVEADEGVVVFDVDLGAARSMRILRDVSSRSWKASAMATSLTPSAALRQFIAAPVPRPPQPIKPTRISSVPAAYAPGRASIDRSSFVTGPPRAASAAVCEGRLAAPHVAVLHWL